MLEKFKLSNPHHWFWQQAITAIKFTITVIRSIPFEKKIQDLCTDTLKEFILGDNRVLKQYIPSFVHLLFMNWKLLERQEPGLRKKGSRKNTANLQVWLEIQLRCPFNVNPQKRNHSEVLAGTFSRTSVS